MRTWQSFFDLEFVAPTVLRHLLVHHLSHFLIQKASIGASKSIDLVQIGLPCARSL